MHFAALRFLMFSRLKIIRLWLKKIREINILDQKVNFTKKKSSKYNGDFFLFQEMEVEPLTNPSDVV